MLVGTACSSRFKDGCGEKFRVGKDVRDEDQVLDLQVLFLRQRGQRNKSSIAARSFIEQEFRKLMFVRVADDGCDAGKRRNFFRSALRVAPGHDNSCQRILPLHAANGSPRILIRRNRNRARVQYDQIGARGGGSFQAAGLELAFECGTVGLRSTASEIFYVEGGHAIIVAQVAGFCGHTSILLQIAAGSVPTSREMPAQAVATFFLCVKHSRHRIGRPWVGRNGTVVSLPHWEHVARVSTRVKCCALPLVGGAVRMATRFDLQALQRLGSFLNCLSWKNSCSPAVKTKSAPQSMHVSTLS